MAGELKQNSLIINELQQGKDLARQLQIHLSTSSSGSDQTREWLAQKILESYETALSFVLERNQSTCEFMHLPPAAATLTMSESSPRSLSRSPGSQELLDLDQFKDQERNNKRKCLSKWTKQVQASVGRDFEGPLDDGYSWRKYGQKDILGAKYPRGYYRCSHRHVQNCLATKQVQRSDEDPAIFDITYCGIHTCDQQHQHSPSSPSSTYSISSPKQAVIKDYAAKPTDQQREEESLHHLLQQQSSPLEEVFLDFKKAGLRVSSTHDSSTVAATASRPHQFCFPSSTSSSTMAAPGHVGCTSIYCTTTTTTSCPSFGNPNCNDHPQASYFYNSNVHGSSESELSEIILAATSSATNSPTVAAATAAAPLGFEPSDNNLVGSDLSFTFDNHWRSL